jgi:hypothetical protein
MESNEDFIPVTLRKGRNPPAIPDPKGQPIPTRLLEAPAASISSQFENILITFAIPATPSGHREHSENNPTVHSMTASTNSRFYMKHQIMEVLHEIRATTPDVVFMSSKTPNLTITNQSSEPQTEQEIETFFHKILYPTPSGTGLAKVQVFFSMITDKDRGIDFVNSSVNIQRFSTKHHTYFEKYLFETFTTGLVGLFFNKVPDYVHRDEFADRLHESIHRHTSHIKRADNDKDRGIPHFEIVPKHEERHIPNTNKTVSTHALAIKCDTREIETLETLTLETTEIDRTLGIFFPYSLATLEEELLRILIVGNNKYADNKSIVKVNGVPKCMMHSPIQGNAPISTILLAYKTEPSNDPDINSKQEQLIESIEETKETDSAGNWFLVINSAHWAIAIERVTKLMTKLSESPEYRNAAKTNQFPYTHRGIQVNRKTVATYSDQLQRHSAALQERVADNEADDDAFHNKRKPNRKKKQAKIRPEDMVSYEDPPPVLEFNQQTFPTLQSHPPRANSPPAQRYQMSIASRTGRGGGRGPIGGRMGGGIGVGRGREVNRPAWQTHPATLGMTNQLPTIAPTTPDTPQTTETPTPRQHSVTIGSERTGNDTLPTQSTEQLGTSHHATPIPTQIQTQATSVVGTDTLAAFMVQQMQKHAESQSNMASLIQILQQQNTQNGNQGSMSNSDSQQPNATRSPKSPSYRTPAVTMNQETSIIPYITPMQTITNTTQTSTTKDQEPMDTSDGSLKRKTPDNSEREALNKQPMTSNNTQTAMMIDQNSARDMELATMAMELETNPELYLFSDETEESNPELTTIPNTTQTRQETQQQQISSLVRAARSTRHPPMHTTVAHCPNTDDGQSG